MKQSILLWTALALMLAVFPALYYAPTIGLALLAYAPSLGFFTFPLMLSPCYLLMAAAFVLMHRAERMA